jgi:hypothetical protein
MKNVGNRTAALLLGAALIAGTAVADAQEAEPGNLLIGQGVVCDTAKQVERFAALIEKDDADKAVSIVNEEESNPVACARVLVAFVRGDEVANVRNTKGSLKIVEITIVAVPDKGNWRFVAPLKQYAAFPNAGVEI